MVKISNTVNRIKSMNFMPIVAFWTDNGDFNIYDLRNQFDIL